MRPHMIFATSLTPGALAGLWVGFCFGALFGQFLYARGKKFFYFQKRWWSADRQLPHKRRGSRNPRRRGHAEEVGHRRYADTHRRRRRTAKPGRILPRWAAIRPEPPAGDHTPGDAPDAGPDATVAADRRLRSPPILC